MFFEEKLWLKCHHQTTVVRELNMEFPFSVRKSLGGAFITRLEGGAFTTRKSAASKHSSQIRKIVDGLGYGSAEAQRLGTVITTASKLETSDHVLYVASDSKCALGLLKVGHKKLFISGQLGGMTEMCPMCVLDFYVHENCQRQGIGKKLFDYMLRDQGVEPHVLAYDRPSPKLLSFLRKYFDLTSFVPQNNNFVVFNSHPKIAMTSRGKFEAYGSLESPISRSSIPGKVVANDKISLLPQSNSLQQPESDRTPTADRNQADTRSSSRNSTKFSTPNASASFDSPSYSVYSTASANSRRAKSNRSDSMASLLSPGALNQASISKAR